MIAWAVEALCAGGEGEATTLLAGADHEDDASVLVLFREAAEELGISLPAADEGAGVTEKWICGQIVKGQMKPQEGIPLLVRIWVESSHDDRFARWLYLAESIGLLEEGIFGGLEPFEAMTLEMVDETILREARRVVAAGNGDATRLTRKLVTGR